MERNEFRGHAVFDLGAGSERCSKQVTPLLQVKKTHKEHVRLLREAWLIVRRLKETPSTFKVTSFWARPRYQSCHDGDDGFKKMPIELDGMFQDV